MTTTDRRRRGVAIAFHCEHAPTRSRVFALVAVAGRRPSLNAVLTRNDATVAELAASALCDAAGGGRGRHVDAFIERVSEQEITVANTAQRIVGAIGPPRSGRTRVLGVAQAAAAPPRAVIASSASR